MLAKLIMSVLVTLYVVLFIPKNRTISWFAAYLVGYAGLDLFAFFGQVWYGPFHEYHYPVQFLCVILLSYSYFSFSLSFKSDTYHPKKFPVFIIASVVAAYCFLHIFYLIISGKTEPSNKIEIILAFPLLMFIASAITFFRKFMLNKLIGNEEDSHAHLAFFVLTVLAIVLSLQFIFRASGLLGDKALGIIFFAGNLFIFSFLVVAFLKYLDIRTTLLVKLVGLSLVLFLLVIGLQGFLLSPYQSVFDVITAGGYDVSGASRQEILSQHLPILQHMHEEALPLTGFLLFSTVLILVLFPLAYDNSVLKPVRRLLQGIRKVNEGDLDTRIPVSNYDEIGHLTTHFNEMTHSLQKANEELKAYAESLEDRVEERTLELNELNLELKTINDQLAEKTTALEQMSQTRTRLFMNISHELRTPITLIRGPIEKILQNPDFNAADKKQLKVVLRNTERLQQLVDQILDLNRWESGQLQIHVRETDAASFLKILCVSLESLFVYNNIKYTYSIPSEQIRLYLDRDKFEKIITNLLSNAVKFTPKDGSVSIEMTETDSQVHIAVTDTGIGIPPDKLDRIFNRFESSSKENPYFREGLGIGLTITKEYTELHHGSISVQSKPDEGTTFQLAFPKGKSFYKPEEIIDDDNACPERSRRDDWPERSQRVEIEENTQPTGPTILLVEDNRDMSDFISSVLTEENYRVLTSDNGHEALKILPNINPDLIISDIMMPVMDGFTFLKKVKEKDAYRSVPTIFLSAISDMTGKLESLSIGVNDYLVKPFNTTELLYRIENLLEFSQQRKEAIIELSDDPEDNQNDSIIPKLTTFIEQRIEDYKLNVDQLAPEVAMSRSTLYREIKKRTGFTAGAFLREIRLQKARQKLESGTNLRLGELSKSVGIQNTSYFNHLYHKRFGKWPAEYS